MNQVSTWSYVVWSIEKWASKKAKADPAIVTQTILVMDDSETSNESHNIKNYFL